MGYLSVARAVRHGGPAVLRYLREPEIPLIPSSCVSAGLRSSVLAQEESRKFVVSLFHSNGLDDDSLNFFFLSF